MRRSVWAVVVALGCAAGPDAQRPSAPRLERPEGGFLVGLTSASQAPQPQADAFARFVQESTGQPARGVVFPSYDGLAAALAKGEVDIAFLSPVAYVRATDGDKKVQAVLRALRGGRDTYRSVLFARKEGRVPSLETLRQARGLKVAWVDASSATGHMFPKAMLLLSGVDPAVVFSAQDFLGSHDAVCQAVATGKSDVGATFVNTPDSPTVDGCRRALGEGVGALQVVAQTEDIPNDVLAVRSDFPAEAKGRLLISATTLRASPEGQRVLETAFAAEGFSQVKRDDYEVVRRSVQVLRQ